MSSQMRPPQSTNGRHSSGSSRTPTSSSGSLFVKVKYNNTLPDIPFDPKFIVNPLNLQRFVEYKTTSLEQNSKHELLAPMDLGVDIDLILPERYAIPDNAIPDPEDDKLITDDEPLLQSTKKSVRDKPHSQLHNKVVPWLKKTEYISTEYNRYGASNEKTETKVGYTLRKNMKNDQIFLDKETQIKAINKTFEAAQESIDRHPTKPDVFAERVMPLLPDFETWKYFYAHVKFDSEPADPSKGDQMSQAIVRGAYDQHLNENFVVYFLPTEVTMADRLLDQNNGLEFSEGKEYEYKSSREYTWTARHDSSADDLFFVIRDDTVFYNKLSMEVTLKKRRTKSQNAISTLIVRNRALNEEELEQQDDKLVLLQKPKPSDLPDIDLTAQSLEKSYEELVNQDRLAADLVASNMNRTSSPEGNNFENNDSSASSKGSSSPSASSHASSASSSPSSSSSSSAEEESENDNDDDDDDNDSQD